jgi:pyruvate dehydrogenase E1 component
MAIVRIMNMMLKDKNVGKNVVPIVPDESRTFGMEGMFRSVGIWNQEGQNYVPEDHDQLMFYKESKTGQVLQEGINESGAMSDWIAAATSYSVHNVQTIPFYICYSMFGMQRVLDLCWAAGDQRARGFLIGGTAGRTTLNGEGLQHEDGHSLILSNLIPNCVSYDPTFQYEVAVVTQDGMRRMFQEQEDVFYYLTVMNENYEHPEMPVGAEADIIKGMYAVQEGWRTKGPRVQLLGSGTIFREVIAAADLLKNDWGVEADLWGCPASTNWRATASILSAGTCCTRWKSRSCRTSSKSWRAPRARSLLQPTTSSCSPSRSVPSSRRRTSRSAPTVSAVRTPAKSCVTSSKSIVTG